MTCDGRHWPTANWCYDCHTFVNITACEHRTHWRELIEEDWAAHALVCVPSMLMPDGSVPTPRHPCRCVVLPRGAHPCSHGYVNT